MRRILLAIAATTLLATPALSQLSLKQENALQRRESSGEAVTQVQRGGLKRDRHITHGILRYEERRARRAPHQAHHQG